MTDGLPDMPAMDAVGLAERVLLVCGVIERSLSELEGLAPDGSEAEAALVSLDKMKWVLRNSARDALDLAGRGGGPAP